MTGPDPGGSGISEVRLSRAARIGFIAAVHFIWILGIAVVIGALFAIAGFLGHEIGGRKHIY